MNVVYLITKLKKGPGPINQAFNLATAMKKQGVNFYVVCISPEIPGRSWENRFVEAGVKVIHLNVPAWNIVRAIIKLRNFVKENSIDIIHSSGLRPDFCNVLVKCNAFHVSTQRCEPSKIGEKENKLVSTIMRHIQMFSLHRLDKVIACSKSLHEILQNTYGIKCEYVQNGVNVDFFKPINEETKLLYRKELNIPLNKIVYAYLGSFWERKDVTTLLEAFKNEHGNRVLLLVGGSDELVDKFSEIYKNENIIFTGHKEFPIRYLQSSDYCISASLSEGLPNTILESLACGVPVILSNIGPHEEILQTADIGVDFPIKNVEELRKSIELLESKNYETMRSNCLKVTDNFFSKHITAHNYIEKYKGLVKV